MLQLSLKDSLTIRNFFGDSLTLRNVCKVRMQINSYGDVAAIYTVLYCMCWLDSGRDNVLVSQGLMSATLSYVYVFVQQQGSYLTAISYIYPVLLKVS